MSIQVSVSGPGVPADRGQESDPSALRDQTLPPILPTGILGELQATMAERYERLGRQGLLSVPVKSLSAKSFLEDPEAAVTGVRSEAYFVFVEPASRDTTLSRWRGRVSHQKLAQKVEAIVDEARPERFIVTIQPFFDVRYNANVLVLDTGEMRAEFTAGDDLPSRKGSTILFSARRDPSTGLLSSSAGDPVQHRTALEVLQAIPMDGEGAERRYRVGYYELGVAERNGAGGILPLFFDYRSQPFLKDERERLPGSCPILPDGDVTNHHGRTGSSAPTI